MYPHSSETPDFPVGVAPDVDPNPGENSSRTQMSLPTAYRRKICESMDAMWSVEDPGEYPSICGVSRKEKFG
jgi:hypothetical protein